MQIYHYNQMLGKNKNLYLEYISKISEENTLNNTTNFLKQVREFEIAHLNGEDIGEASNENRLLFLNILGAGSTGSIRTYISMLGAYISYCKAHKLIRDTINLTESMTKDEILSILNNNKYKGRFFTKEQFDDMINRLEYFQDKVLLQLLFEGIKGSKYSDILTLKVDDINFDKQLVKGIKVSEKLIYLIAKSINEEMYDDSSLLDSPFIIRKNFRATKYKHKDDMNYNTLINRLSAILKDKLGYDYITPDSIYKSGILYKCKEHLSTLEDFKSSGIKNELFQFCYNELRLSKGQSYKIAELYLDIYVELENDH